MNGSGNLMNTSSLLIASSLVFISVLFSYFQKLELEKDIAISALRAVVQLVAIGYLLGYIFELESPFFTTLLLLAMTINASYNAAKRGRGIKNGFVISFISISAGALITLSILLLSGAIKYEPYQVIPISGMIISNSMIAIGLCHKQLMANFKGKREDVETKLSLGADILPSSIEIIRDAVRTGIMPTVDSAKTVGIVALPGMMTGLILAGTSPVEAIKYQIMVTFMMLSTTSIASFISCYLAYRGFFNDRKQLVYPA